MSRLKICKYCGKPIANGEVWNPDENGNGYHHACLIDIEFDENKKRVERLAQNSIIDKINAELIQSIQNGTLKIESGNEELFHIINKYKVESEE